MEWQGEGRIIAVRSHGETSAIIEILTQERGRYAGLVRAGRSRTMRPVLQPGNRVNVVWRARLEDHLGQFSIEPDHLIAGQIMDDPLALSGLNAACAMASTCLPEREPHQAVAEAFEVLIQSLETPEIWPSLYIRWEMGLLGDLGYGLDLNRCAATGRTDELIYVSPKSGLAVSREAGEPYHERMLKLPSFLVLGRTPDRDDLANGLKLTAYFLERRVLWPFDRQLPQARHRMIERLHAADML